MPATREVVKNDDGTFPSYAWPGGYPLYYITADSGVLCPDCVNKNLKLCTEDASDKQWHVVACEVNWEDAQLNCDNCYERVQSAYAEPE